MSDAVEADRRRRLRGSITPWDAVRLTSLGNLALACLLAVPLMVLGAAAVLSGDAVYESRATILLDHRDVREVPDATPIHRLNALRSVYAALVPTQEIAGQIAEDLGVPAPGIARRVSVVVNQDSLVMYPTANGSSPAAAERLATALSQELVEYVERSQVAAGVAAPDRVVLRVVDPASGGRKIEPTGGAALAGAALFGGLGLLGVYVVLQLLTATRRVRRMQR